MIIPSYSLSATERILPRLALDFTTAITDPRVVTARALNTATRFNSNGLVEIVNANLPRYDFDPITKVCRGQIIEETRANLFLRSEEFENNSVWQAFGTKTVTSNIIASPDGTVDADLLSSPGNNGIYQQVVATASTSYTMSVFVKAGTGTNVRLSFATSGGTGANGFVERAISAGTDVGNGWYRHTYSFASAAGDNNLVARIQSAVADATPGIYIWGAQLEVGVFATSYIPTTTTSLTRNADAVSMTGTNFSDWYNAAEGAFEAEYSSYVATNASNSKGILAATDGTTGNRLYMNINTAGVPFFFVSASSSTQANINTGVTLVNDVVARTVAAYKLNSFAASTNGSAAGTDTLGNVPAVNRLDIGSLLTSPQLNGHFRKLMYWPQRITNAETQAFSK